MTGTPTSDVAEDEGWRADPGWRLTWHRADAFPEEDAPQAPTGDAELSQPPNWATLYSAGRPVAVWFRPSVPRATVGADDG